MSLTRQIAHNTIIQVIAKIVDTGLAMIALGMMTRYLGQEGYGQFTVISSFAGFFGVIADFGLYLVSIQMMSEVGRDERENYNTILTLRIVTLAIVLAAAVPIAFLLPYSLPIKIGIVLFLFSVFLNSAIQLLRALFQIRYSMHIPFAADVAGRVALIGLLIGIHAWELGLYAILFAITLNNIIPAGILFAYARARFFSIRLAWNRAIVRETLSRSWPIALSIILNLVYLRGDVIILSLLKGEADVGLYGAAYRVVDVLVTFPPMFMGLMLASFARAWSGDDMASFRRYTQRSFEVFTILALPLVAGAYFLGSPIMRLVAGEEFAAAGEILAILALGVGIVYFSSFFGYLINVIGEQRRMIAGYLFGALAGIAAYLALIPPYSSWGAAWGTVISELTVLAVGAYVFFRKTRIWPSATIIVRALAATGVMSFFLLAGQSLPLFVLISLSILIYGASLWCAGGLPKDLIGSILTDKKASTQ